MTFVFSTIAVLLLLTVGGGLVRILRGPTAADRMMGAQLLGTAAIAILLVLGIARRVPAAIDLALILALLAPFATIAFVRFAPTVVRPTGDEGDSR